MIDGNERLDELEVLGRHVADAIVEYGEVRLISHNDADGLSAAGIMCNALYRRGILFHTTIVSQFNESTLELINKTKTPGCAVILCDMGSSQVELTSKVENAIIIDHHKPTGELEAPHFNPHLAGIDGASLLSASGGAYMVARQMGDNTDLAGLALVGATGDKQVMESANRFILDEALENNVVSVKKGLLMGDAPIGELLEYSIDPYLDITGDRDKIKEFLDETGFKGRLSGMPGDELRRLVSIIVLKLAKQGSSQAAGSLVGDALTLNCEVIPNVYDFVDVLNACGKSEKAGIGIDVCMRNKGAVDEAVAITRENQRVIIDSIRKAEQQVKSAQNFRYVVLDDVGGMGIIAGIMTRYRYTDKPFIAFNEVEDMVKVSGRGTRALVDAGLDLAFVMKQAAGSVGGRGGGHDVASGASIPKGSVEGFVQVADSVIGEQLGRDAQ
jgi:single-stranded DNA-specific DHH superfamily exonuclease